MQSGHEPIPKDMDFTPNSAIGQHLLLNTEILEYTASLIPREAHCIEIGPGLGALTERLLTRGNSVKAYEIDQRCDASLGRLAIKGNLEIVWGNFLRVPSEAINSRSPYHLVGNIPYNISEPLLKKMAGLSFDSAVLLVGEKMSRALMATHPDEKSWSQMSMISHGHFTTEIARHVPRESFNPIPRTQSAIIVQQRKDRDDTWCSDALTQGYRALFEAGMKNTTVARALKGIVIDDRGNAVMKKNHHKTQKADRTRHRKHQHTLADNDTDMPSLSGQGHAQTLLAIVADRVDTEILSRPLGGICNSDLRRLCSVMISVINHRKQHA